MSLPRGSFVLDAGCGDGKYFAPGFCNGCWVQGVDISEELVKCAVKGGRGGKDKVRGASRKKVVCQVTMISNTFASPLRSSQMQVEMMESEYGKIGNGVVGDCLAIPFVSDWYDGVICIAGEAERGAKR